MTKSACAVSATELFRRMRHVLVVHHHVNPVLCVDINDRKHRSEGGVLALLESPVADALSAPQEFSNNAIAENNWIMSVATLLFSFDTTVSGMYREKLFRCR